MPIYVVSSIRITKAIHDAFNAGLTAAGGPAAAEVPANNVVFNPTVGNPPLGYGLKLNAAIKAIAAGANDVLATLGGLVSFVAALDYSKVNFVSLVGGTAAINGDPFPTAGTAGNAGGVFLGYVSLESYASDLARVRYLKTLNYTQDQISLFYNPNSHMQGIQVGNSTTQSQPGGVDSHGANNSSYFSSAFQKITTPAVMISADPFFYDNMGALVLAANQSGKFICYPLQDYKDSNPLPEGGVLHGPNLVSSITDLGTMAGQLYNAPGTTAIPKLEKNTVTPIL